MVTFTRRHYIAIAEMLKEIDQDNHDLAKKWAGKWHETFVADNPRYDGQRFMEFIFGSTLRD